MTQRGYLPRGECRKALFTAAAPAHVDAQALDLLIQRGEWNEKAFRGFRLVPAGALEHVHNDAPLNFVHDLK